MDEKISVIVPIFKVEKYLRKCVDSILNQTYRNLEVILVDDGSPDGCPAICDEYAEKDSRVRVIHKKNGGLSDARNAGLDIASGEVISFIDSDDWIEPTMYQRLMENMHRFRAEVSVGGVTDLLELENGYKMTKTTQNGEITNEVRSKEEAMEKYFMGSWSAWDKLYQRKIFETLRYPVGEINEDEAIVLRVLEQCSKVAYTNESFYNYISRSNSITTASFHKKKLAWVKHCYNNLRYIEKQYPALKGYAEKRYFSSIVWAVYHMALDERAFGDVPELLRRELRKNKNRILTSDCCSFREKFRLLMAGYAWGLLKNHAVKCVKNGYL